MFTDKGSCATENSIWGQHLKKKDSETKIFLISLWKLKESRYEEIGQRYKTKLKLINENGFFCQ